MNNETTDFLRENLIEAHNTFMFIIDKMKKNNISFMYNEIEEVERNSYKLVMTKLCEMNSFIIKSNNLREENKEIFSNERILYVKYISLYIVSFIFLKLNHEIFKGSELDDMLQYFIGMFLGSTYIGLLSKDINDNRSDTKEKRDLINNLKTMKEEYKKDHDFIVNEIDGIFATNTYLWNMLDKKIEKNNMVLKKVI